MKRGFRRAQVSSFIVVGLIIVIIAALLLYLNYEIQTQQTQSKLDGMQKFSSEALKIKPYIQDCVKQQSVAALLIASRQDTNDLQQLREIEEAISNYLNENIKLCTNFGVFKEYEIEAGNVNTSVNVFSENFVVKVEWPIIVKQNDLVLKEDRFDAEFPLKLNELYEKVKNVVDGENTLDVANILNQQINVEIKGCSNGRIQYIVNDNDYSIDGNVFQFFFNEKIENLIELFNAENNKIKFLPKSNQGKIILRKENQEKRMMFEVDENRIIKGCGNRINTLRRDELRIDDGIGDWKDGNGEENKSYNFYLVEDNSEEKNYIGIGVSIKEAKKVEIKKIDIDGTGNENGGNGRSAGDETNRENRINLLAGFDINAVGSLEGEIFIKNIVEEIPVIYYNNNGNWEEINSKVENGFVVAGISKIGKYALGEKSCSLIHSPETTSQEEVQEDTTIESQVTADEIKNIVFIPLDYNDLNLFNTKIEIYKKKIIEKKPNLRIYQVSKKGLNCLNLDQCDISIVDEFVQGCDAYMDFNIGLIGNSIVGNRLVRRGNTILVGTYSTTEACENCEFLIDTLQ